MLNAAHPPRRQAVAPDADVGFAFSNSHLTPVPDDRAPCPFLRGDFPCYQWVRGNRGTIEMDSEKVAGILGAIVAAVVLVIAIAFGPIGQMGKPAKQMKVEQPAQPAPAPAVRGPVVREVPQ
jgi:hypothetical protein